RISRQTYIFTSEQSVRSISEFRALSKLISLDLPVPLPVAAWYKKVSRFQYRAAIIVERIPDAQPLADRINMLNAADWRLLGQTIRRFHDYGVRHADLNCFNVLIAQGLFYLIDFDKGRIMPSDSRSGWKANNLARFARSLRKVAGDTVLNEVW